MIQTAIAFEQRVYVARKLGTEAGERCTDKAVAADPYFRERAADFIAGYIRQQGQATGESATLAAVLAGINPADRRSFGPIYAKLIRDKRIVVVGEARRVFGNGSRGGSIYAPGKA